MRLREEDTKTKIQKGSKDYSLLSVVQTSIEEDLDHWKLEKKLQRIPGGSNAVHVKELR